jgi:uroporphyrinogen-III decarboxylase
MITGMDRLGAAIRGDRSDRIPVFCNLLDQGAAELGMPLEAYYRDGEAVAEAQLRMRQRYGHDNVWSLFYVGKEAELLGCQKVLFAADGPPNVEHFVVQGLDDIARLEVPAALGDHPAFTEVHRCMSVLRREVGGRYPICAYITATMMLPALLMGFDQWMQLLFGGPPSARDELLEKCHRFFVAEVALYRSLGADVIVYSNPFGSPDIVPMRYFQERSLPWIERDIAAIGTAGVVYYCGMARFNPVIETVLARTGLGVYYLSPLDDIAEAKRVIAGRALTCGLINDIELIDWPAETIRTQVKRIIDAGMPGGRFLFGTGVMPLAIPGASISTMLEAAYEYGRQDG